MPKKSQKTFVLDTNVILHDSSCIYQFHGHHIVIPISVFEELDHFKKGNLSLNFHAREFLRTLDALSGDKLFNGGIRIGPNQGRISVTLEEKFHPDLELNFAHVKSDHRMLNATYHLAKRLSPQKVILVSKDVNLRMKAKAIGLMAEDYTTDHVKNISAIYTGNRIQENIAEDLIERMYHCPFEIEASKIQFTPILQPNEYIILKNGRKSALSTFNPAMNTLKRVDKVPAYGIMPRNAEQTFALNALMNNDIQLISISGKAGTGKTLIALAAALEQRKHYRQIFLARPVVPLSNKDLGYLPGDIQSKLNPYMQPLFDNLGVIQNQFPESDPRHQRIKELLLSEKLTLSPLAYIRGRSLVKVFFIVDEAQNLTPHEIKTIITRAGEGTKMVFTGDIHQIDHPYLDSHSNGLSYLIEKMKGQNIYAHVTLKKGERSRLAEIASDLL